MNIFAGQNSLRRETASVVAKTELRTVDPVSFLASGFILTGLSCLSVKGEWGHRTGELNLGRLENCLLKILLPIKFLL